MQYFTERLVLRAVNHTDANDLFRIYGDPATNLYNPAGPYPTLERANTVLTLWLAHWETQGYGNFAIALREDPHRIVGFGGLNLRCVADEMIHNLGYRFDTSVWGKGVATEFASRLIRYGFTDLPLPDISAVVRENNLASKKVLEKSGLRHIGVIADVENAPPSLLFRLTREQWSGTAE